MRIIAIEEAFSFPLPGKSEDASNLISSAFLSDWAARLEDITSARIADMDANGIDIQVLSLTVPGIQGISEIKEATVAARASNDYLAKQISQAPDRFRGFAALPLQDPTAAVEELRRCVTELGFCGALVNDHTNGHYLDEPQFDKVWTALEDLDVPLYLHPGAPKLDTWKLLNGYPQLGGAAWGWGAEVGGHAARILFGGVFDRHPKARLILGHMGEFLPFQLWRFDSRYQTFAKQGLTTAPSEQFKNNVVITTSGVFSTDPLMGALSALGEDSILFAIDYPYELSKLAVKFLMNAPVSEQTRQKIAYGNAERLLKIGSRF